MKYTSVQIDIPKQIVVTTEESSVLMEEDGPMKSAKCEFEF